MKAPAVITIDFETKAIESRPVYPPEPVGVAIKWPGKKGKYFAWRHPTENNCDKDTAIQALAETYASKYALLFHHAKFDTDVAQAHMGMPATPWERVHDTLYQVFLENPHADSHGLKQSAERVLGLAPAERDDVREWLVAHKVVRSNDKKWGAHIADAPGGLVGKYAIGDVDRAEALHKHLYPLLAETGMLSAYDRERELMPILLRNEREGLRVDLPLLHVETDLYVQAMDTTDKWLRKRLKALSLNVDSNEELADALDALGLVDEWVMTAPSQRFPAGQRSTSKENMGGVQIKDAKVAEALNYRGRLGTYLGTFMSPWLAMAQQCNGRIHTSWNQVRQYGGGNAQVGARTGRLSSTPNFQNIPRVSEAALPKFAKLPALPNLRRYILPERGQVIMHRDYSQQELRVLAHFEGGGLSDAYADNPLLDVHTHAQETIAEQLGLTVSRNQVKIMNFGILYGMGNGKLAVGLGVSVDEAKKLKQALYKVMPGVKKLEGDLKAQGKAGLPTTTWGGRRYFVEEPKVINGRVQTFEYKLLNYLIQGSSADMSKQAIINYNTIRKEGRLMLSVHDELNCSVPKKALKAEMRLLNEAMSDVAFDVPILSSGKVGINWGALEKYND